MTTSVLQNGGMTNFNGNLEELRKSLPHVNLETGLKHRVIKRDPISGLGDLSKEHCEFGKSKITNQTRKKFNTTLLSWDADTAAPLSDSKTTGKTKELKNRNPIALTGDLGKELDTLRCTSRPRTSVPREPQRNPISGNGNFGNREWDPIWKYNGKARRAQSSTDIRCNPLTGENAKTFTISTEEKNRGCFTPRDQKLQRNILTGANCANYEVCVDFKPMKPKKIMEADHNTITGENCNTYDVNVENSRTGRARVKSEKQKTNPVNGENVNTFIISKEERFRQAKQRVYTNTVTGENCPSYKINPIEKAIVSRPITASTNPVLGENSQHYTYRLGEKQKLVKKRDISSPLTGLGSRGNTYMVSVEERQRPQNGKSKENGIVGKECRNILTGENCNTYMVCQEMRSERKLSAPSQKANINGAKEVYNIINGSEK